MENPVLRDHFLVVVAIECLVRGKSHEGKYQGFSYTEN
jgi:hypothetical protein